MTNFQEAVIFQQVVPNDLTNRAQSPGKSKQGHSTLDSELQHYREEGEKASL